MREYGNSAGTFPGKCLAAAAAAAIATLVSAGSAHAALCLADQAGDPTLGCTANDFAVSSVTVSNVDLNDCGGATNSFQFDGFLNIATDTTTRYDLGFYISNGLDDALTGASCSSTIVPIPPGLDLDSGTDPGDLCGDFDGNSVSYPIADVSVKCVDADNNGFFDLSICSAWDNNASGFCDSIEEAIPSTQSKCRCFTVNTDVEAPHCDTNADCADDANPCTDPLCVEGAGDDGEGCTFQNNTDPCDDGLFCNGADTCVGGACDGHAGDPCPSAPCSSCNEAEDDCFVGAGTPCRASAGVCDVAETCDGSTTDCPADGLLGTGTTCRGASGVCDVAEVCNGTNADCPADGFAGTGTLCRADAGECDMAENCDGTSGDCPADGGDAPGTPCTDDGNVCTDDECDGSGSCTHPNNTDPCNDGLFCTENDTCSGGSCSGSAIDCSDAIDCTDDSCDEVNDECDNDPNNALCNDDDTCTSDICSIAQNGCVNTFICTNDVCRSPGYWSTHSGLEKDGATNVTQELLDLVGGIEVCGQEIDETSNLSSPYMSGLFLDSALEGLCMRTKGVKQRQLYRQLVAAGLNCAVSGLPDDCDSITSKYIDVLFSDCSDVCEGLGDEFSPTTQQCIKELDCFNNGGQVIDGTCAYGSCEDQPEIPCGGPSGSCPDFLDEPQACIPFPANCHDAPLCVEEYFCPKQTPAASRAACKEARHNGCTIDDCPTP